jgi:hypothetical protein
MRVMKTAIPRGDGSQLVCDTIQHEGKLWLAPAWLEEATKPYSRPVRLIGMSGLKYRSMPMRSEVDFVMEHPVPEAVLEGRVQGAQTAPFIILERPDVRNLKSVLSAPVDRTEIGQA